MTAKNRKVRKARKLESPALSWPRENGTHCASICPCWCLDLCDDWQPQHEEVSSLFVQVLLLRVGFGGDLTNEGAGAARHGLGRPLRPVGFHCPVEFA